MAVALRDGFTYEGYAVNVARDGQTGLRMASEKDHDLLILDVMLPRLSGLDVCRQLRSAGNNTPIIMLTARGQEIDKVLGLKTGADDYVTKPFSFLELMARVEAVLRRATKPAEAVESFEFGDVVLNFKTLEATKDARPPFDASKVLKFISTSPKLTCSTASVAFDVRRSTASTRAISSRKLNGLVT